MSEFKPTTHDERVRAEKAMDIEDYVDRQIGDQALQDGIDSGDSTEQHLAGIEYYKQHPQLLPWNQS